MEHGTSNEASLQCILPDLYACPPEHPSGNSVQTTCYIALRASGEHVLFYGSSRVEGVFDALDRLGGVSLQLVNHRHEATPQADLVRHRFGARFLCHLLERQACAEYCNVDGTFEEGWLAPDLLAMHTPGHCPGSTCFLWNSPHARVLFTGDTLYLSRGKWCVTIEEGNQKQMCASLKKLLEFDVDILVPSLFIGNPAWEELGPRGTRQAIQECIERLENGAIH